jgi:hypothetical protein
MAGAGYCKLMESLGLARLNLSSEEARGRVRERNCSRSRSPLAVMEVTLSTS